MSDKRDYRIKYEWICNLLKELDVDYVHILVNGQIVETGTSELAKEIE